MKNKIKILYDGIQLQLTDSLTKVFWDERPKAMAEEAAVQALRGECVSFQLAYSFEGWRFGEGRVQSFRFAKVKVESPVLPYLQVRKVMNVPSRYAAHKKNDDNYLRREPGLYQICLRRLRMTVLFSRKTSGTASGSIWRLRRMRRRGRIRCALRLRMHRRRTGRHWRVSRQR